jgi:hypothetical protein
MTLMSMTFDESYGTLPTNLLRAYRKFNVSPADHDLLVDRLGDDWKTILAVVESSSSDGYYKPSRFF